MVCSQSGFCLFGFLAVLNPAEISFLLEKRCNAGIAIFYGCVLVTLHCIIAPHVVVEKRDARYEERKEHLSVFYRGHLFALNVHEYNEFLLLFLYVHCTSYTSTYTSINT